MNKRRAGASSAAGSIGNSAIDASLQTSTSAEAPASGLRTKQGVLMGEKISLGPVLSQDMQTMFSWRNDPEVSYASGPYIPIDEVVFSEWVSGAKVQGTRVLFSVRNKHNAKLLGYTELYNIEFSARSAEFGIAIGLKADRGRGYGQDATKLALEYCWKELRLERVSLRVVGDNPVAVHVYKKVGFEIEGKLRRAAFTRGQFHDLTLMGILRPQSV